MSLTSYMEMAHIMGVSLSSLLTHGQQIRILLQIVLQVAKQNLAVPSGYSSGGNGYETPRVIGMGCCYYEKPIVVLNFTSLYPSFMMANNLCYTTLLNEKIDNDYIQTPLGDYSVTPSKR